MKSNRMNTQFFNFRLFVEGLKRLRVIGLATAILAVTVSALVPLVFWIEQHDRALDAPYEVGPGGLCVPASAVVLLAPFFFFVLFSFLQKRKESDFFHAIPYTRTCVYNSFVTAALAFVWAIQLTCGLVAGILWGIAPHLIVDLGALTAYVLLSMLAAAMLSAFMMLSLTVSGTGGSCVLLFFLFATFVRVVSAIFLGCIESIDILDAGKLLEDSFLSPLWFLPINIIYYWGDTEGAMGMMYRPSNILYSLAVTVLLFTLAGLIYKHRRSEMAGNPAPGKTTQALFRILFTTLPALLIPLLILVEGGDAALLLVLVVSVVLVYYLYELVTTKRPKNLLKITPGLGIILGICFAFTLLFYGYRGFLLNENITVEEVKTVSVSANGFRYDSYQSYLAEELRTDDPAIVKAVVDQLAYSQKAERKDGTYEGLPPDYWDRMTVTLHLKGGRSITRYVIFDEKKRLELNTRYMELEEIRELAYLLPTDKEVNRCSFELCNLYYTHHDSVNGDEEMRTLLSIFRREFAALTDAEKQTVMTRAFNNSRYEDGKESEQTAVLYIRGRMNGSGEYYNSEYLITETMPETRGYMLGLWGIVNREANYYERGGQTWGGCADDVLAALARDAKDSQFSQTFPYLKGNVTLIGMGTDNADGYLDQVFYLDAQSYARLAELLSETSMIHANTELDSFTATPGTYMLTLHTDMENKYSSMNVSLYGLFDLTEEEYSELKALLQSGR